MTVKDEPMNKQNETTMIKCPVCKGPSEEREIVDHTTLGWTTVCRPCTIKANEEEWKYTKFAVGTVLILVMVSIIFRLFRG